ncbi:E3 ubiquitin-protein ligase TRIM9-like [Octopus sinensis]|uniref:E3 ubiquitin-protein ligase TRIM9-like n=1 Tax=Octopus sinensis TaxID=2607531 RepID=A0A6P7SY47_9MOLL|nr:E3 ubiquitin-protein ligase TRIM9-like [Octopus sinensis]
MEEELKCPVCSRYFCNPVLLPCFHSLCMVCAVQIQELLPPFGQQSGGNCGNSNSNSTVGVLDEAGAVSVGSEQDLPDIDKLSIVSETDSGVICNSRPNSYIGSLGFGNIFSQASSGTLFSIRCPVCKKIIYLDEHGVQALPKSSILESIIEKFGCGSEEQTTEDSDLIKCQLCEQDSNDAACMCEQCEVFYCDSCRERCHPFRGPLAKHKLVSPCQGQMLLKKNKTKESKCQEHVDEQLSMFCQLCKVPVCYVCAQEGRHINHDVQALGVMCKTQKNELSQNLQSLSEKAKSGTIFIQRLKSMTDRVECNCTEFQKNVIEKCDELIESIRARRQYLLDTLNNEKEMKILTLKEQVSHCTSLLQRTTGLLQFGIEVLKESDAFSFLQISNALINRVSTADENFNREIELTARVSPKFELGFDNEHILQSIENMDFYEMKAPGQPVIIPEDCSAENNSVTIAWQPHPSGIVETFTLELDDGNSGDFRVVYVGRETMCTVDGLHFNSIYNARVKAHNNVGESNFSEMVSLQTAEGFAVPFACLNVASNQWHRFV